MEWKSPIPVHLLQGKGAETLVEAYFEFNHLKQLYRQGWLRRGVPPERCESVAEHTLGVALLAWFLADAYFPELDTARVLRLALLHDFGEIYAGDMIPSDPVSAETKHELEWQSVQQVLGKLPNGAFYLSLWQEYEDGSSPEARLVRQVDRLEMGLQAGVYEHQGFVEMHDFFDSARRALKDEQLQQLLQAVQALRP